MTSGTALVLIDVQRGLIEGFEDDWAGVLATIAALVERARAAQVPVVYVQHDGGAGHPLEVDSAREYDRCSSPATRRCPA